MSRLGEWNPKPGTLPGRTEMRVLRAMKSLAEAGADEVHLGAIYGFVDEFGHPPLKSYDYRWQLQMFMKEKGYKLDYSERGIDHEDRRFVRIDGGFGTYGWKGAQKFAEANGFVATWSPHESTVDKRLRDLQTRGFVKKIRPAIWTLTKEGKHLLNRLTLWTEGEVYA